MSAPLVTEHLEIVEQLHLGLGAASEPIGQFVLTVEKNAFITVLSQRSPCGSCCTYTVRVQHALVRTPRSE
jgi:hypothetical protein